MKNLLIASLISAFSFGAIANGLTYTQIILTKDSKNKDGFTYLASPMSKWCNGISTIINYGSYEAAKFVESLENGLYVCDGKFVTGEFISPVQIFEINKCGRADAVVLEGQCP